MSGAIFLMMLCVIIVLALFAPAFLKSCGQKLHDGVFGYMANHGLVLGMSGFLHGVEVLEIDNGPRPIATLASAIIGIVGTAPDSQGEVKATLLAGDVTKNTALTYTAKLTGVRGNKVSVAYVNPRAMNAALAVAVNAQAITVSLATDVAGVITSTAAQVEAAILANDAAAALVGVVATGASTGAGVLAPMGLQYLSGGVDEAFPLNTPVLVAGSPLQAAALGKSGTLPVAMNSIFEQSGPVIVVVRVEEGADDDTTRANVIGGTSADGTYTGAHVLVTAESILGVKPRILIAPGFTDTRDNNYANAVVAELLPIADRLRAVIIADGPSTNYNDAVLYAGDWGSKRIYMVDPRVVMEDAHGQPEFQYSSPIVAGLICKQDNANGFWWSPSNQEIGGIIGTERPVDFALGDQACMANLLNAQNIATIIRQNGYRLWGNRTLSADPKWAFLSVVRTGDLIEDSILRAHLWAVDRNITKTYVQDVVEGVNDYLRSLQAIGAILGGSCWADPALNTPDQIAQGHVTFDFDFTPPAPAERITFRSHLVNDYIKNIFQ